MSSNDDQQAWLQDVLARASGDAYVNEYKTLVKEARSKVGAAHKITIQAYEGMLNRAKTVASGGLLDDRAIEAEIERIHRKGYVDDTCIQA